MAKGAARPKGTADEPKFHRLIVGLTPELHQALLTKAAFTDRPLAWLVRKALAEYLGADASAVLDRGET